MKRLRWEAALVGVVALAATLAATERTPLTWDEGDAFVRAERVAAWTRAVVVGPEKLREALKANGANSEDRVEINDSNGNARGDDGERRRFGDVEGAALEYFSRFEGRRALFSERAIEAGWPHAIYREGHPAGYSIAIALGRAFAGRFLPFLSEKTAFRLGPIFLFALALAAVFYRVGRNWGRFAAILAVVGIATIPRAFGHAQLAGGDSLLISSWLLTWAFFDAALASKRGAILFGWAVGVSFCAKFSGFAVVAPATAGAVAALWALRREKLRSLKEISGSRALDGLEGWRALEKTEKARSWEKTGVLRETDDLREIDGWRETGEMGRKKGVSDRRRDGVRATLGRLSLAAFVAAAVFFASNPPLWARPLSGFETFVSLNLRRDGFDIPIYFLGKFYSPTRPLPWWNGFFWLATTVPTALLAFAALGSVATAARKNRKDGGKDGGKVGGKDDVGRRGRRTAALALAFAATLPIVRVAPGIPTHDGARLLIASFPFVAILAAFGAVVFVERCGRERGREGGRGEEGEEEREGRGARNGRKTTSRRLAQTVVVASFAVGFVDLVRSAPQYLSFYNATLGGVVGAQRRGMEATYYWDAFDADAVAWLNAEIAAARADGRPTGVLFGSFSSQTLDYYRRWETLATPEIETLSTPNVLAKRGRFGFYVLQRRPSGLTALDLALLKTARPIYRGTIGNPFDFRSEKAGRREVALLEIYDFRDVERALTGALTGAGAGAGAGAGEARSQRKDGETAAP